MNLDIVVNNRHACVGWKPVFSAEYKILDTLFRGHDDFFARPSNIWGGNNFI